MLEIVLKREGPHHSSFYLGLITLLIS